MAARNSLFDVFQYNSWIKKSNYEGIFNAVLFIFFWTIIHKPIVSRTFDDSLKDELYKNG